MGSWGFRLRRRWRPPLELRWDQLAALRRSRDGGLVFYRDASSGAVRRASCPQLAGDRLRKVSDGWRRALAEGARSRGNLVCTVIPEQTCRDRIAVLLWSGAIVWLLFWKLRFLELPELFGKIGLLGIDPVLFLTPLLVLGSLAALLGLAVVTAWRTSRRQKDLARTWASIRLEPGGVIVVGTNGASARCRVEVTDDGVLLRPRHGHPIPVRLLSEAPLAADLAVALESRFEGGVRRRSRLRGAPARLALLWGPLSITFIAWLASSGYLSPARVAVYISIGIEAVMLGLAGLLLWQERVRRRVFRDQLAGGPELLSRLGW